MSHRNLLFPLLISGFFVMGLSKLNPDTIQVDTDGMLYRDDVFSINNTNTDNDIEVSGNVHIQGVFGYRTHTLTSGSESSVEVNWASSNIVELTINKPTGNVSITFQDPPNPTSLTLFVRYSTSIPATFNVSTLEVPFSAALSSTATAGKKDLYHFYFDGSNYFVNPSLNF